MSAQTEKKRSPLAIFVSYYKPHLGLFLLDMACALGIALVVAVPLTVLVVALAVLLPRRHR